MTKQQNIASRILKTEPIKWRELQFIQQDNFKEWTHNGSEKLIESILKYQFISPFMVWQHEGINYCLDGRHRFLDLDHVSKSGNKMRESLQREPSWDEIIDYAKKKGMHVYEGASIFDPVLCELSYRWFCPEGGRIIDPFAGGSVRGVVAGILGFEYAGIDLRKEQVEANTKQAKVLKIDTDAVKWFAGDSNEVLDEIEFKDIDFVYSCPPYADLEKYSDDPKDLSNMDYADFKEVYFSIIKKAVSQLKDDRFACFVVGDVRDKKGFYYNFVSDTIQAFKDAGMELYNEMILVNVVGSLAIRVRRQFNGGRKVGKMHQNVLVFYKGDPKKIKENFPELNLGEDLESLNNEPNIAE